MFSRHRGARAGRGCASGTPNAIYAYNTDPGSGTLSVGVYAVSMGTEVWADNNAWRTSDVQENVFAEPGALVKADAMCSPLTFCPVQ